MICVISFLSFITRPWTTISLCPFVTVIVVLARHYRVYLILPCYPYTILCCCGFWPTLSCCTCTKVSLCPLNNTLMFFLYNSVITSFGQHFYVVLVQKCHYVLWTTLSCSFCTTASLLPLANTFMLYLYKSVTVSFEQHIQVILVEQCHYFIVGQRFPVVFVSNVILSLDQHFHVVIKQQCQNFT